MLDQYIETCVGHQFAIGKGGATNKFGVIEALEVLVLEYYTSVKSIGDDVDKVCRVCFLVDVCRLLVGNSIISPCWSSCIIEVDIGEF